MTLALVRIAISCSIALRRSPKPGALTASNIQHTAQFVQHQGRQRFAINVLGNNHQVTLANLNQLLQQGYNILAAAEIFLS